jgi:hypothetical protein
VHQFFGVFADVQSESIYSGHIQGQIGVSTRNKQFS